VTLPLVPLFMVLVGLTTRRHHRRCRALDRIAAHVAELVRGCRCWSGWAAPPSRAAALAELGEASRRRSLSVLRLAFLSALVLSCWPRCRSRWSRSPSACGWCTATSTWPSA
jgi:ATP-binding cassette subfamily C protein CydCD